MDSSRVTFESSKPPEWEADPPALTEEPEEEEGGLSSQNFKNPNFLAARSISAVMSQGESQWASC